MRQHGIFSQMQMSIIFIYLLFKAENSYAKHVRSQHNERWPRPISTRAKRVVQEGRRSGMQLLASSQHLGELRNALRAGLVSA